MIVLFLVISFFLSIFIVSKLDINFLNNTILFTASFYLFFGSLRDLIINKFKKYITVSIQKVVRNFELVKFHVQKTAYQYLNIKYKLKNNILIIKNS